MAKSYEQLLAAVRQNHPDWTDAKVQQRAMNRYQQQPNALQSGRVDMPAQGGSLQSYGGGYGGDPLAEASKLLFGNILGLGGDAGGWGFGDWMSQIGGGFSPISAPSIGSINPAGVNINLDELRSALEADARAAEGKSLGALDARVALGGLPGSSRHGVAQAQVSGDINRALQSELAQANYNAYDADAARRLAAEQANLQGQIANANNVMQAQALNNQSQLGAAQLAGSMFNNMNSFQLDKNSLLLDALSRSYDVTRAQQSDLLNNQYGLLNNQQNNMYNLLNNQQDRAMNYGMFGQNMDYLYNQLLMGGLAGKNDAMAYGLGQSGNMDYLAQAPLGGYNSLMGLLGPYAGAVGGPQVLGSGNSFGAGLGRSDSWGTAGGGSVGGGSSYVCSHMYANGLMDEKTKVLDEIYGWYTRVVSPDVYQGYAKFAIPLVHILERSPTLTRIVNTLVIVPWSIEMSRELGYSNKKNLVGQIIMSVGRRICKLLGK